MTNQEAHDALADVLWWLKGFRAGTPGETCWRHHDTDHNIEQLRAVQDFVKSRKIEQESEA